MLVGYVGSIDLDVSDDGTPTARALEPTGDTTAAQLGSPSRYAPISPIRVLDTRTDLFRRRLPANGVLSIAPVTPAVSNASGVTAATASAVVVNITMVDPGAAGFATVWPTGSPQPTVSSLNADFPGQNVANLVTVPLGADGFISIYLVVGADYIVDVQGVYVNSTSSDRRPLRPDRTAASDRHSSRWHARGQRITVGRPHAVRGAERCLGGGAQRHRDEHTGRRVLHGLAGVDPDAERLESERDTAPATPSPTR